MKLWADSDTARRQTIVAPIIARVDMLGFERMEYRLCADATDRGLDAAHPPQIELGGNVAEFGRGERI